MNKVQRALLSVSDKTGLVDFARRLHELKIEILSTGGTAALLRENDIPVIEVSDYTGFPEMMDGRVKTLHPSVHGGILARRGIDDAVIAKHGISTIDMVVVNLYPFEATVAATDCTLEDAIENIDIGGPTMLRAAAKNHASVAVVVSNLVFAAVADELESNQCALSDHTRFALAVKAFEHTSRYDGAIANYLGTVREDGTREEFPQTLNLQFRKLQPMRYGENPHQQAAFYIDEGSNDVSVARSEQIQGKELSYNNVGDTDAALECVKSFPEKPACVIVKHANPCGVALGESVLEAYDRAYKTDPTSAFGGIIAFNRGLDVATASAIVERQFVEVIIAPEISAEAIAVLATKKNIRVLSCGSFQNDVAAARDFKKVTGGLLVQDRDFGAVTESDLRIVTSRKPTAEEMKDLLFSWRVAKFVKSNAIVYCKDNMTIGVGAGQMSRVYSAKIAGIKAADEDLEVTGSVMASDAFFPFRDGIDNAASVGITAVIQPGGSMRDEEVIAAADEHGMAMVFTGMRHFRH